MNASNGHIKNKYEHELSLADTLNDGNYSSQSMQMIQYLSDGGCACANFLPLLVLLAPRYYFDAKLCVVIIWSRFV